MALIPPRLKLGDTIGVKTPSAAISISPSQDPYGELEKGMKYLEELGFKVFSGEHAKEEGGQIGRVNKNSPCRTAIGQGQVDGRLLGGNDWFVQLLLGTRYIPDLTGAILFVEVPGFDPEIAYNRLHHNVLPVGVQARLDADAASLEILETRVI